MPDSRHARPTSTISSASFHSFGSTSSTVDRLPAYSPSDCEDGAGYRCQYATITTVRIRDKDEDDEPLSATLKRLGAKRKTAILPTKIEGDDDEWEDVDEPTCLRQPSKFSLRQPSRKTSSRSALRNLKPLPNTPNATVSHHPAPVPDGWGGRLTRPSWFPSHQPGPLLKTPVPQSSLLKDPRLASLLQPLPGAGKAGDAPIKAVRFASLLPTWRSHPHAHGAAEKGATGGVQPKKALYAGRYTTEQDLNHDPLPRYQQDPAWPSHEDDVRHPSSLDPFHPPARTTKPRRTVLIRTSLATIALILLVGLAVGLSSHSHSHSPSHPHSHARPSSGSATTASRIKPDVATTESTVQSATSNAGVPSWTSTPTQGAPPLLVSSSPAAGKTSASATSGATSSTAAHIAAPATPAASSTGTNVLAGSHHAAFVSQAVAQAVGQGASQA